MFLEGKKGVIFGVANAHSLAWGIAQELAHHGASLAFTYQGETLKKRVVPLAESLGSSMTFPCDVAHEIEIAEVFRQLKEIWGVVDFVVHSIGFSDKEQLRGRFLDTTQENFLNTMNISCYSFLSMAKHAYPLMNAGGSLLTLTYYGAVKVVPHYNVMGLVKASLEASVRYLAEDLGPFGIRVNAISAGPVKTLAASGIGDFNYILRWNHHNSPLRRNITQKDVGKAGLYLISDLASGVTGEIHYVDAGYNIVGMKAIDAPDITLEKNQTSSL